MIGTVDGPVFHDAEDTSGKTKDGNLLADIIARCIESVGPENVVLVITDNAKNCVKAGVPSRFTLLPCQYVTARTLFITTKQCYVHQFYVGELLEEKYPHVMWTGCLAHGLNLAMKDFGKLEYVKKVLSQANCITNLVRNSDRLSSTLESLQAPQKPLVLLNPGETRFCASITMCARLLRLKEYVEELASSDMWDTARDKAPKDRRAVFKRARTAIKKKSFWQGLGYVVNAMEPMKEVLRLADSDEPSMGFAYSALLSLQQSISEHEMKLSNNPITARKRRTDVKRIVDNRMEFIMQPIYRAGYALNPHYRTETFDEDVMIDLEYVLTRMLGQDEGTDALAVFQTQYCTGRGLSEAMEKARKRLQPHEWWKVYGARLQPLAKVAMRILAQIPSASACERNWSSYKFIHNEKRNKLGKKRARDLVSVFQNMRAVKRAKEGGMIFSCDVTLNDEEEGECEQADSESDDATDSNTDISE